MTAQQLAFDAREAGLDFIGTTDHNTSDAHEAWGPEGAGDDFLVILGEEVTTRAGHWLALGLRAGQLIDWRYGEHDGVIARYQNEVHDVGGLCVAAHPYAPYPSGQFCYGYDGFDLVEVWNGLWASDRPWNADNAAALAEWSRGLAADIHSGTWRPALGASDTHLEGQLGAPHTVVLADGLNTGAILRGLRAGRSWITDAAEVELSLIASAGGRSAGLGERLDALDHPITVRLRVAGVPAGIATLHTDTGTVHGKQLAASGPNTVEWVTAARESAFVRAEVRYADGLMAALTNPILLT